MAITTIYTYPLNGTQRDFTIPFEYLARRFVAITLIGTDRRELTLTADFRFLTKTLVQTNVAWGPADGYERIEIRRNTSATDRLVDFADGSILRAAELNTSQVQTMHIAEEARNMVADTIAENADGDLDARGRRLANLADATDPGHAVTLRQEQEWAASTLNNKNASAASATQSANSAAASEASKVISATKAGEAATSATQSANSAAASEASKVISATKAGEAATSATQSANSAAASEASKVISATKADEAAASAVQSANSAANLGNAVSFYERVESVTASEVTLKAGTWLRADAFLFRDGAGAIRGYPGFLGLGQAVYTRSYGTPPASSGPYMGAIEVREAELVATSQGKDTGRSPSITFHYGGYAVNALFMPPAGSLCWGNPLGAFKEIAFKADLSPFHTDANSAGRTKLLWAGSVTTADITIPGMDTFAGLGFVAAGTGLPDDIVFVPRDILLQGRRLWLYKHYSGGWYGTSVQYINQSTLRVAWVGSASYPLVRVTGFS